MEKNWKLLVFIGIIFVLLIVGFLVWSALGSKPGNTGGSGGGGEQSQQSGGALDQQKENQLKEFVKNFINLYNTYSYGDYSNPLALGDYQTPNLQQKTSSFVANLEQTIVPGYSKVTTADEASFSYKPSAGGFVATINAQVAETSFASAGVSPRQEPSEQIYEITATLTVLPSGNGWVADEININTK